MQKNDEYFMLWEHDLKILGMLLKIVFSVQTHLATLMNPCNYRLVLKVCDLQRHTGVGEYWSMNFEQFHKSSELVKDKRI